MKFTIENYNEIALQAFNSVFNTNEPRIIDIEDWQEVGENEEWLIEVVDSVWWYEWGGDEANIVFKIDNLIEKESFFIRINWFYSSWNWTEWYDEIELVEPREVLVTQYYKIWK